MKRLIYICSSLLFNRTVIAQNRFPKPDFESGYTYPEIVHPISNEAMWTTIDIVLLIVLMCIVTWAVIKNRTRKPIIWTSIISIAYFGFFRSGCVCSIGSIQNISLALVDNTYILPLSVFLLFILPVIFTFLFGRVFCAGVCPFGALQELVNVKNHRLSQTVTTVLGIIPWLYLIFAILYAITRSSFIICRFDPFIGIFRLGGDIGLILFGILLLISSVFVGRPFCRFICPYGALLSLFSRVSIWKVQITPKPCINCELCHNACPVDAIKSPYENKVKENRKQGTLRVLTYFTVLPLMIITGALLMRSVSDNLSSVNKEVRLYQMITEQENKPQEILPLELEAFYGQGSSLDELSSKYEVILHEFKFYSTIAGALIGLVFGLVLIRLSLKRTRNQYEIDYSACVACGRCFKYCPQNKTEIQPEK